MASSSSIFLFLFFILSSLSINFSSFSLAQTSPPLVKGLSWTYYKSTCPKLESVVRDQLKKVFKRDIRQAATLLRIHFHDCFVQGCDGSVLLDGSASTPSEKDAIPNLTLTPEAFETINDLRDRVQKACGQIVSCTDIVALAARDSVYLSGGPDYRVPLGRRDGLTFATPDTTLANLPSPFSNVSLLLAGFAIKKLNATDLVALSGGHTIGIGHCPTFTPRLYPTQDPTMDKTFAKNLYATCPAANTNNSTVLDIRSPNVFDNKYFVDLMNRQGLFTSDQDLYTDKRTREIVLEYAVNQTVFFEQFALSMVRMSQLSVLTGNSGQIRGNCSARNSGGTYLSSLVDTAVGDLVF